MKTVNLARRNLASVARAVEHPDSVGLLDASGNSITDLRQFEVFKSLVVLDLSNNYIYRLEEVLYLRPLRNLQHLNLLGNVICQNQEFRLYVIRVLPYLTQLNLYVISSEETVTASIMSFQTSLELPEVQVWPDPQFNIQTQSSAMPTLQPSYDSCKSLATLQMPSGTQYIAKQNVGTREMPTLTPPAKLPGFPAMQGQKNGGKAVKTPYYREQSAEPKTQKDGARHLRYAISFDRPPQPPSRVAYLYRACELETYQRIFQSISNLLDLLDNTHLCLLEEICKGKREGRGNPTQTPK